MMQMCNWRAGERTFMAHVRWCYPRTLAYLVVVTTLILLLTIMDLLGGF